MELSFIFYILVSIAVILGSIYFNIKSGKDISAAILGIGFIIISVTFGLYLYTPSGSFRTESKGGAWPPTINVCPDFLSLITKDGTPSCIDPIGVSNASYGLQKWSDSGSDAAVFDLALTQAGQARVTTLCKQCAEQGLTWEGVFDGTACLNNNPPIPVAPATS
jgi:hypothetical protein